MRIIERALPASMIIRLARRDRRRCGLDAGATARHHIPGCRSARAGKGNEVRSTQPEPSKPRVASHRDRIEIAVVVLLCLSPALSARAQTLPPGVAACAAETDVLKRLSCFDREVAPFLSQPRPTMAPVVAPVAPAPGQAAGVGIAPATSTASTPASALAGGARRIQARISSIDNYPDGIVLHLDNGQVWAEDEDTPVELGLRVGDSVTIEHQLTSFWASGRNGTSAKVRLKN